MNTPEKRQKLRLSGWIFLAVVAWLPARLLTPYGAWFNTKVFALVFIILGAIYWRFGPVILGIFDILTGRTNMAWLGSQVLENGGSIHADISGPALHGTYKNYPVRFQRLSSGRRWLGPMAIMLECPMAENFELAHSSTDEKGQHSFGRVRAIPGFQNLFGIANGNFNFSRLSAEPIQWLGRTCLLLVISPRSIIQVDPVKFKAALDVLIDIAHMEKAR